MSIIKLSIVAVLGVVLALNVKSQKAEYSVFVSMGLCLFILSFALERLHYIVEMIHELTAMIAIDKSYILLILKLIGISYISEFASALCKEAGFGAISGQIELAGKLTMVFMSIPIVFTVLETIQHFLKGSL